MFNNSFPFSANLPNTFDSGNTTNSVPLPENATNNISEFFDNYNMIYVERITFTDNSKDVIYINLCLNSYSFQTITIENPEKKSKIQVYF